MSAMQDLLSLMATLRDPDKGCPWDVAQDFHSIAPYTIEEAYEVADAIQREDMTDLRDELGDLLFQVVFHAQMAREQGAFDFDDVARGIHDKMVRRHPHVFGDQAGEQAAAPSWEALKAEERRHRDDNDHSALAHVPATLPGLTRAAKLTRRAARVGFDWPSVDGVIAKVREELAELEEACQADNIRDQEEEFGDLLFACANLGRHLGIDPERALRGANTKFESRFRDMEQAMMAAEADFSGADMATKEAAWEQAKRRERGDDA